MKRGRRWFFMFALSLFLFGMVQDASSSCASGEVTTDVCHACVCGPHIVPMLIDGDGVAAKEYPAHFERSVFSSFLTAKDIFHPPKTSV
ncbi:MAG: hypothetical protein IPN65_01870 [Elusimicrobia bacterium]|nr:hypothetical protein [Elusimicrobiota bacterium]MBK7544726.1 hypothetical protein [Elusimicrobiota bacterium]MBK7575793.1 hypothetical protein [Elusimicrobiota bacterium]MBK7688804.1 hypothetical protein [Elusimicrobiota bacterium]MBK8126387.1 hypothetical protein [Elusimicrobiota bacterium]